MPHTKSYGVDIHYQDEGDGRPLLLIHGHTLDQRIWDWLAPGLKSEGLRLIRPDLRGHGRSSRPDFGYHWIHHSADMVAVMDASAVDHCAVVGYSLGGGVALEMAITLPERVDALVLLSPVLPDRPFDEAFFANLREVAAAIRNDGVAAAMRGPWMSSPLWSFSEARPELRQKIEEIVGDFPGAEYLATQRDQVERNWLLPDRLVDIDVPTLVVVGEEELPGFISWSEEISGAVPEGRLERLAGHGHMHLLEDPARIAELITEHLKE